MKLSEALRQCAEVEKRIGEFYDRFAGIWAQDEKIGPFWRGMADAERTHASVLEAAAEYAAGSDRREPVDPSAIAHIRGYVIGMTTLEHEVDLTEAFRLAVELEGLELDELYRSLIQLTGGDFLPVSATVKASLEEFGRHEEALFAMIEQHVDDARLLAEVRRRREDAARRDVTGEGSVQAVLSAVSSRLERARRRPRRPGG